MRPLRNAMLARQVRTRPTITLAVLSLVGLGCGLVPQTLPPSGFGNDGNGGADGSTSGNEGAETTDGGVALSEAGAAIPADAAPTDAGALYTATSDASGEPGDAALVNGSEPDSSPSAADAAPE